MPGLKKGQRLPAQVSHTVKLSAREVFDPLEHAKKVLAQIREMGLLSTGLLFERLLKDEKATLTLLSREHNHFPGNMSVGESDDERLQFFLHVVRRGTCKLEDSQGHIFAIPDQDTLVLKRKGPAGSSARDLTRRLTELEVRHPGLVMNSYVEALNRHVFFWCAARYERNYIRSYARVPRLVTIWSTEKLLEISGWKEVKVTHFNSGSVGLGRGKKNFWECPFGTIQGLAAPNPGIKLLQQLTISWPDEKGHQPAELLVPDQVPPEAVKEALIRACFLDNLEPWSGPGSGSIMT